MPPGDSDSRNNTVVGTIGDDFLADLAGDTFLSGLAGDDVLEGKAGDNVLDGGDGNDTYVISSVGSQRIVDANGRDTIDVSLVLSPVTIDLREGFVARVGDASLRWEGRIEDVWGGKGNDFLVGNSSSNAIDGGGGDDRLVGVDDRQRNPGWREFDRLTGGMGSDRFVLGRSLTAFYNGGEGGIVGMEDYALIADFDPAVDRVELAGDRGWYRLDRSPVAGIDGNALYLQGFPQSASNQADELIAIFEDAGELSLDSVAFGGAKNGVSVGLSVSEDNIVSISGNPATLTVTAVSRDAAYTNEMGVVVLDADGTIDGIRIGEDGFLAKAMARSQVLLSAVVGVDFQATTPVSLNFQQDDRLCFYLVQNGTTAEVANGATKNVFFATGNADGEHLQIDRFVRPKDGSDNNLRLKWEDLTGGGDRDFNDLQVDVNFTLPQPTKLPYLAQTKVESIDLSHTATPLPGTISIVNNTDLTAKFGFYRADDYSGSIGNLLPSDPGYTAAAEARKINPPIGTPTILPAYQILIPFIEIANPATPATTYLPFPAANPQQTDIFRTLGNGNYGLELVGNDGDFNDIIITVQI